MKTKGRFLACILVSVLLLMGLFPQRAYAADGIAINGTNFPDSTFRWLVSSYDKDSNGTLSAAELKAVTEMDVSMHNINSLKGIEHFTSLRLLNCSNNKLTELDLSKNTALTWLLCYFNSLTSLDLSKNTALLELDCFMNDLTSLNVSKNTKMYYLDCSHNQLTSLDLSKNAGMEQIRCYDNQLTSLKTGQSTKLTVLECGGNPLPSLNVSSHTGLTTLDCSDMLLNSLDISKNTKLAELVCYRNQLTSLDLSKNTKLEALHCSNNRLTSLNVSKNTKLTELDCGSNQIKSLDLSKNVNLECLYVYNNQLTSLNIGNNTKLMKLDCTENQIGSLDISDTPAIRAAYIGGEEKAASESYEIDSEIDWKYAITLDLDPTTNVVVSVLINTVNFPDAVFRELVKSYDTDKNDALDVSELKDAQIMNAIGKGIKTLKGIECFSGLTTLGCGENALEELDVSLNPQLAWLLCQKNQLRSLNISRNGALHFIICEENQLAVLDLKGAPYIAQAVREGTLDSSDPKIDQYIYTDTPAGISVDKLTVLLPDGNPFIDVSEDKFYYAPVMWAFTRDPQITGGTAAARFSPSDVCTRGQVVTFLWRAKGCPEPKTTTNPFVDVKSDKFFYKAVLWAVENKITTGTDSTHFSPNDPCTRGQVVTFLWRTEGSPKPKTTTNPFKDVKKGAYYYDAMLWAVESSITTGTSATTFEPGTLCNRGQVVTFLYRDVVGNK